MQQSRAVAHSELQTKKSNQLALQEGATLAALEAARREGAVQAFDGVIQAIHGLAKPVTAATVEDKEA